MVEFIYLVSVHYYSFFYSEADTSRAKKKKKRRQLNDKQSEIEMKIEKEKKLCSFSSKWIGKENSKSKFKIAWKGVHLMLSIEWGFIIILILQWRRQNNNKQKGAVKRVRPVPASKIIEKEKNIKSKNWKSLGNAQSGTHFSLYPAILYQIFSYMLPEHSIFQLALILIFAL